MLENDDIFAHQKGARLRDSVVFAGVMIVVVAAFAYFWQGCRLDPDRFTGSPGVKWGDAVKTFYEGASGKLMADSNRTRVEYIILGQESNSSGYLVSSPCNAGFSRALIDRMAESEFHPKGIYFWGGPRYPSRLSTLADGLISSGISDFGRSSDPDSTPGWYFLKPGSDSPEGPFVAPPQTNVLALTLEIRSISTDYPSGRTEAVFGLNLAADGTDFTPILAKYSVVGDQLNWFIRRQPSFHRLSLPMVLLAFTMICWKWARAPHREIPPVVRRGLLLVAFSQSVFLTVEWLLPMNLRAAEYDDARNLYYLVDINSELWTREATDSIESVGIKELAKNIEDLLSDLNPPRRSDQERSFWKWVFSGEAMEALFRTDPPWFRNPFQRQVRSFSGADAALVPVAISSTSEINPSTIREARLSNPRAELSASKQMSGGRDLVVLLTSACAPCIQEVGRHLHSVYSGSNSTSNLQVVTLLVPTVPVSGADRLNYFAEGKFALASIVSDVLVPLDGTTFTSETVASSLKEMARDARFDSLPNFTPSCSNYSLAHPLVGLSEKTTNKDFYSRTNSSLWDQARNLDPDRRRYLRWTKNSVSEFTNEIKPRLEEWFKPDRPARSRSYIYTFGAARGVGILAALFVLVGVAVFSNELNLVTFTQVLHSPFSKLGFNCFFLLLIIAAFFCLFWAQWLSLNPETASSFGINRVTFAFMAMALFLWTFPSKYLLYRNISSVGYIESGDLNQAPLKRPEFRLALWCVVALAFIIILSTRRATSAVIGVLILVSGLNASVQYAIARQLFDGSSGRVEWWRRLHWSLLLKAILLGSLILLLTGCFGASFGNLAAAGCKNICWTSFGHWLLGICLPISFVGALLSANRESKVPFSVACLTVLYFIYDLLTNN